MVKAPHPALTEPPVIAPLPLWIRQDNPQTPEDASFFAGAALAALHPVAQSGHPVGRLWRQRLALSATARLVAAGGHAEDEAALREAHYLCQPGDDPGPAGRILLAWRSLTEPAAIDLPSAAVRLASLLEVQASDGLTELLASAAKPAQGAWSAISAAAAILAVNLASDSEDRNLALWLADIIMARSFNWPAPVPLLALHVRFADLNGTPHEPRELLAIISSAYARAAAAAVDLYIDLACRASALIAVAPKFRSRDAISTVERLLCEDALLAAEGKTGTPRANRRLFDRLVELNTIRELTGRSDLRLYGL